MRRVNRPLAIAHPVVPAPKKTPSQVAASCLENIQHAATSEMKFAKEHLDKFGVDFAKDPLHAMEWAADVYKHTARYSVGKQVLEYLELVRKNKSDDYESLSDVALLRIVREEFYRLVLNKAKWPERSTSMSHNETWLNVNAQRAEWLERFDNALEHIREAE